MFNTLIFDLDGVIVDTAKYHYLAWKKITKELGFDFGIKDNELLKGVSRRRSFEIILELNHKTMSDEMIEENCRKKNEYYLEYIGGLKEEEILPGVKDFIEDARNENYSIVLGSASKNSRTILDRLRISDLFDSIVDGTRISNAKPDPEVFLQGAKDMNVQPEECIVFEDSAAGISAAHNGKMKAVGVSNHEIRSYCDYFFEGFANTDIKTLIRKISGE